MTYPRVTPPISRDGATSCVTLPTPSGHGLPAGSRLWDPGSLDTPHVQASNTPGHGLLQGNASDAAGYSRVTPPNLGSWATPRSCLWVRGLLQGHAFKPRVMDYPKVMPLRSWTIPGSRLQTPGHGLLQGQASPPTLRLMGFLRVTTPLSRVTDSSRVTNRYPRSWATPTAVGHLE